MPASDKSHAPLTAGLYVVATPIGNLEDITLRALRVLREADLIACEDTRHTQKLLNHFEITTPTQSYHEHNEAARARELVEKIEGGARIALVSDAGTPGVSDPGERVIRATLDRGLKVIVVPGPAALISALVVSGLPTDEFRFVGFLPPRSGDRRSRLEGLCDAHETLIFYEAPHRIVDMVSDLEAIFGRDRRIAIAREVTKKHEEFLRGTVGQIAAELRKRESAKGEITVIVERKGEEQASPQQQVTVCDRLRELMATDGLDEKAALKQAAREFNIPRSQAYREWQRSKDRYRQ